jgi:uncharacterized protein YodC (DUF2158 family)
MSLCDSAACIGFRRVRDAASVFIAVRCCGDDVRPIWYRRCKVATRFFFSRYGGLSKMTVLKPGDLVILKSGGPVMTVDTVNTDIFDDDKITGVLCAWFVGNKLERARFDPDAIGPTSSREAPVEKAETPPAEAAGEYKTLLEEMVTAMNDTAEAQDDASRVSVERSKPASARKYTADVAVAASRSAN